MASVPKFKPCAVKCIPLIFREANFPKYQRVLFAQEFGIVLRASESSICRSEFGNCGLDHRNEQAFDFRWHKFQNTTSVVSAFHFSRETGEAINKAEHKSLRFDPKGTNPVSGVSRVGIGTVKHKPGVVMSSFQHCDWRGVD